MRGIGKAAASPLNTIKLSRTVLPEDYRVYSIYMNFVIVRV